MTLTTRAPLTSPRLRQLVARGPVEVAGRAAADPAEVCELCTAPVPPEHRHLIDLDTRELVCACRACALLFDRTAAGNGHLRLVPDRRLALERFRDGRRAVGAAADPGRDRVLLRQLAGRARDGVLPEPARADRVSPDARGLARAREREPGARHDGARRRGAARQSGARRAAPVARPDRGSLPARRGDPHDVAWAHRRERGVAATRRLLRRSRPTRRPPQKGDGRENSQAVPRGQSELPSHTPGINKGNSKGNYEQNAGFNADSTSTAARSTGIDPKNHEPIDPSMPNLSPA